MSNLAAPYGHVNRWPWRALKGRVPTQERCIINLRALEVEVSPRESQVLCVVGDAGGRECPVQSLLVRTLHPLAFRKNSVCCLPVSETSVGSGFVLCFVLL